MDTADAPTITLHKSDGGQMVFIEHEDELYVHDTSAKDPNLTIKHTVC
jgi:hypothetical protein